MTLAPLADLSQFAAKLRRGAFTGDEVEWAGLVLDSVSSLVRSEAGRTWEGVEVPDAVRAVTLEVARRVWTNPDAATSSTRTNGPFGRGLTWADPTAVGLYLSPEEKRLVKPRRPGTVGGLWTLGTTRADPAGDTIYVPVQGSPNPFPWYGPDVPR